MNTDNENNNASEIKISPPDSVRSPGATSGNPFNVPTVPAPEGY